MVLHGQITAEMQVNTRLDLSAGARL